MGDRFLIIVALYGEDASFDKRLSLRELISSALNDVALGKQIGGGSWISDEPNYNLEFEVVDQSQALTLIRDTLRIAGVGASTELLVAPNQRYNVFDDSWTDLGPRAQPPPPARRLPKSSPQDFLAELQRITTELKEKYGKSKDPDA